MTVSLELHGEHIHSRQWVPLWEVVWGEPCWHAISCPMRCSPLGWDSARLPTQLLCTLSAGAASGQLPRALSICHSCSPCIPNKRGERGTAVRTGHVRSLVLQNKGKTMLMGMLSQRVLGETPPESFLKTHRCLLGRG